MIGALMIFGLGGTPSPAKAEDPAILIDYADQGLGIGATTWIRDEESGTLVPAPPGHVSEDPNQYKYEILCKDDVNGSCV
ncbi:MAG TPA: hypothetical protein DDY41_03970 [Arthrobacter bacterium]|nr:hypothetical protein [Arthrobacter sp.]